MKQPKKNNDPAQAQHEPVTQAEFAQTMTAVQQTMQQMNDRMATKDDVAALDQRLDRVERVQEKTFSVVESIDQQLKEWKHIPEDVERLKHDVFGLQVKVNRRQ